MTESLKLPIIDLSSPDRISTAKSIRQAAFFLDPNYDCVVKCLESCCSESCPPRFPPIRLIDYLNERFREIWRIK